MNEYATRDPHSFYIAIDTDPKEHMRFRSDLNEIRYGIHSVCIKMIIKKRFGAINFVRYLGLKDVYYVGPKPKKKKQDYIQRG